MDGLSTSEGLKDDTGSETAGTTSEALKLAGPNGDVLNISGQNSTDSESHSDIEDDAQSEMTSDNSSLCPQTDSLTDVDSCSEDYADQVNTMEVIQVLWDCKGALFAIQYALCLKDLGVMVCILQILADVPSTWTTDICSSLMPTLLKLFKHNDPVIFSLAATTLKFLVSGFKVIIMNNLNPPKLHSGKLIDFGRIRRYSQCVSTYEYMKRIADVLKDRREEFFNTPMFVLAAEVRRSIELMETSPHH